MFAINRGRRLVRLKRKPSYWLVLEAEGWIFLPENRVWDADERTAVADASELAAHGAFIGQHEPDRWWKRYAASYVRLRDPIAAFIDAQAAPAKVCFGGERTGRPKLRYALRRRLLAAFEL